MKLTKVEKARIAVSREKKDSGRIILYTNPEDVKKTSVTTMEQQVSKRIDQANKLYQVFFKSVIPVELNKHFAEISKIAAKCRNTEEFYKKACGYSGYEWTDAKQKKRTSQISRFSYTSSGKNMYVVMDNFVKEYMVQIWQEKDFRNAAVKILCCICDGKKFASKLEKVKKESLDTLKKFIEISGKCEGNPFVDYDTSFLEKVFTLVISQMVKNCDRKSYEQDDKEKIKKSIQKEIQWLSHVQSVTERSFGREGKTYLLFKIRNPYATEERLQTVLIRMRKTLKRGRNRDIAIVLLQGLAQMNQVTFTDTVKHLYQEEEKAFCDFIDAVNRDYYRVNIVKSVRNMDVKVQPDLNDNSILKLSGLGNIKKEALSDTLLRYAASADESDQVLLDIKKLLFEYFLPENSKETSKYTTVQNLWNIPYLPKIFFDYGFENEDSDDDNECAEDIETLCDVEPQYKINQHSLKRRIRYVNYGKYLQMTKNESDRERRYWIHYIKEFVEKNYVDSGRTLSEKNCYASSMMLNCWKEIIRYLCGKYIDIGKAVFHFTNLTAMPKPKDKIIYGQLEEQYKKGISSFDYEAIKAEETLQRDIVQSVVAAAFAFSKSVIDETKMEECQETNKEDILFLSENVLGSLLKENTIKLILRFYGGESSVAQKEYFDQQEIVQEMISHLKSIRNENFHYLDGAKKDNPHKYASILWKNDEMAYQKLTKQRYYANNVGLFYRAEEIQELVQELYSQKNITEAQIPAFRTVLKRKDLPGYMEELGILFPDNTQEKSKGDFEGTLYFLMKEIYYRDFIVKDKAAAYFFKAVDQNKEQSKKEDKHTERAAENFHRYVKSLEKKYNKKEISFGTVCQYIMMEYNQQNTTKQETEIYKHFKMLISLCIRKAFGNYIKETYRFLFHPIYSKQQGEPEYLDTLELESGVKEKNYEWFTLAHFLHPVQLNHLVGDLKSYIQYREDILRRIVFAEQRVYADQQKEVQQKVKTAKEILEVLEFVREVSGRVSNEYTDYYENEEEYAEFLYQYIDFRKREGKSAFESLKYFCQNILDSGTVVDLYADTENPKVLRNIELTRMYAGSNVKIPEYEKITEDEIKMYYQEKNSVALILSRGLCRNEKEQKKVIEFNWKKKRLTLNEITDVFSLVNDLLGKMISFSYLRERDQMYLLLGFYYMALCAENKSENHLGWKGETLDKLESSDSKFDIGGGLVLYQIVSAFNFGSKLLYISEDGRWKMAGGAFPGKYGRFENDYNHRTSLSKVIRLFENESYEREIIYWRDYVDHMKYYVNQNQSIMEIYSAFYSKVLGYSAKLRKSVVFNLQAALEKHHINPECIWMTSDGKCADIKLMKNLESQKFTYKLAKREGEKTERKICMNALNENFLKTIRTSLEYKK